MSIYKTGFCSAGFHEGTRPTVKGKPVKVCTSLGLCKCECHKKLDRMYEMAKTPRVPVPNPDYIPYESGIMAFIEELNSGNMDETAPSLKVTEPKEVPLEAAPTLALSAKSFAPTATGYRAPGQLENEIRDVCNRYMMGEFEDGTACTPKFIQQTISSEPEPSVGAIGQAFKTWERIGFAVIDKSPMRFVRFTADGMRFGLDEMKRRAKGQRRSARRSA